MEQPFPPGLPEGVQPDIQLCIFPHLREFIALDTRGATPSVTAMHTDAVLNDDFFRAVESEFSQALRERVDYPFAHLMTLPMHLEETIRDIAMSCILEHLGLRLDDERELPAVVVYVVGGGGWAGQFDQVLQGIKEKLREAYGEAGAEDWGRRIAGMAADENAIVEQLNRQQLSDALSNDSPDFFTLWENRN